MLALHVMSTYLCVSLVVLVLLTLFVVIIVYMCFCVTLSGFMSSTFFVFICVHVLFLGFCLVLCHCSRSYLSGRHSCWQWLAVCLCVSVRAPSPVCMCFLCLCGCVFGHVCALGLARDPSCPELSVLPVWLKPWFITALFYFCPSPLHSLYPTSLLCSHLILRFSFLYFLHLFPPLHTSYFLPSLSQYSSSPSFVLCK